MKADQLSLTSALGRWSADSADKRRLAAVIHAIAEAGIRLSGAVAVAPLEASLTKASQATAADGENTRNASGDEQKPLDLYAEKMVVDALAGLDIAAICSEESQDPILMTPGGSFVVAIDPVDGSSNIDVNAPIGTIFSVLPSLGADSDPTQSLLQPGRNQLAAGMIIYGAATIMVLTLGAGTDVFVLDPRTRYFRMVQSNIQLPADSQEYAINAANARHWGPGISEYIADLVNGEHGPRERSFNMRWLASLVAEAYRILNRGGIFLYPADARAGYDQGRIRMVYEANPISFLIEQAGGQATDGVDPILDLVPRHLHQQVPLVFGSQAKVERVRRYLLDPQLHSGESPLFSSRGLFRARQGE